ELGDGWYSGYIGWNLDRDHYGDQAQLLVQLELEYTDGTKETVASDQTWQATSSATIEQDFLMGEGFDARLHQENWNTPNHASQKGEPVDLAPPAKAPLQAFPADPVRAYEKRKPVSIKSSGDDRY